MITTLTKHSLAYLEGTFDSNELKWIDLCLSSPKSSTEMFLLLRGAGIIGPQINRQFFIDICFPRLLSAKQLVDLVPNTPNCYPAFVPNSLLKDLLQNKPLCTEILIRFNEPKWTYLQQNNLLDEEMQSIYAAALLTSKFADDGKNFVS